MDFFEAIVGIIVVFIIRMLFAAFDCAVFVATAYLLSLVTPLDMTACYFCSLIAWWGSHWINKSK